MSSGRLTGMTFEKVAASHGRRRPPRPVADRRARRSSRLRRRADRRRTGERLSLDRAGLPASTSIAPGLPKLDAADLSIEPAFGVSLAAIRRSARRTSSPRSPTAMRRRSRSTPSAAAKSSRIRPPPMTNLVSQKMGIHEWSYDNAITHRSRDSRFRMCEPRSRLRISASKSNSDLTRSLRSPRRNAVSIATCRRFLRRRPASNATPASTFVRSTASHSRPTRRKRNCARSLSAPADNLSQAIYVSEPVKTGRVMAKDEDLCLHCGLCAERCPTGAWDMQKFTLEMAQAGHTCRSRA